MEKTDFSPIEEGGINIYTDIESNFTDIIIKNPELACPNCGAIVFMNGHCKTCPKCGWSTCDI